MPMIAVIGAGPLGGAVARALALRSRIREVRLIDPDGTVAEGKALDIEQSAPIEQFATRITGARSIAAAGGADAIVLADLAGSGEISGENGLALLRQLARLEGTAPFVCGGGTQRELMMRGRTELAIAAGRLIGSAPLALESAVTAVVAALLDASPNDLSIGLAGVPPGHVAIGWQAATAFHQPIADVLAPHQMAAVTSRLAALWPPSPYTLASAAARVAEAAALGSRRRYTCFACLDGAGERGGVVAAVPVVVSRGGVGRVLEPALSRHERTAFENGLRSRG
jgi:malate dehydrogenase